ncbi:MAG: holo-ACP synthase, partial [Coriobacteriales bacterium]|nr:holo-ACP synthase [Coriobacteriales bacterium]
MIDQTAADDQPSAQHPAPSAQQVDAGSDTAALNPAAGSVLPEGGAPDDGAVAKAEVLQDLPVAGTGIDIVEIARMERAITRTPRILWRLFSAQEQAYCNSKARPATHYALFFAAKEAVLKALGTGFVGMAFHDVEVAHDRFGRPVPVLHGHAQEVAAALGVVELQLSLSYTHQVGVASAVAIKQENRPHKDESLDPHAELARQFKELR